MKIVIQVSDSAYAEVGERYIIKGSAVTVRDSRGRVAWRGFIDGYKKDGRANSRMCDSPSICMETANE